MMKKTIYVGMLLLLIVLMAACNAAGGAEPDADTAVNQTTTETTMAEQEDAMADEMADPHDDAMMEEKEGDDAMSDDAMMEEKEGDDAMSDDAMTEEKEDDMAMSDDAMMEEKEGEAMMADDMAEDAMMPKPAWQTIALTDVRTGQTFTLADFAGKTVFVETMATWCSNCRRLLGNVATARGQMAGEDVVFVALSVETNISDAALADYTEQTGFDWTFAVASPAMLQELAAVFGQSITNPPSTPHFVIRPDGSYTDLATGIKSPDAIISQLQEAGG
ncbi:MAG TPA: redoxin domain-containing protein [Chloroflexota bacterium]|nr:redoxin domain-containing protein [Chloroflexota bacterium]